MPENKDVSDLPIMKYREEIARNVRNHPITIIFGGETGCGKSTKIPQFIMDDCRQEECNIIVSQPRRIGAITLARRVSNERNCELGSIVGYQIGLSKKLDKDNHQTKLLFCTTGVILQKIIYEKTIDRYTHIILDEIHERDVDTDLLMMVLRDYLLLGTTNAKLILMSATLNPELFKNYFTLTFGEQFFRPALISIQSERKFGIEIEYLDDMRSSFKLSNKVINYSKPSITLEMYNTAAKIISAHLQQSAKSILVFLPGLYEIESAHAVLSKNDDIKSKCIMVVLHSSLPTEQQKEAFIKSVLPKVILSTNIAESSITIPGVDCVIDFCLTKNIVCEGSSLSNLKLEFASRFSCIQRAGRTGRVCDGIVYRLIDRRYFDHSLLEENIPEMQRAPLESVVLKVKSLDYDSPIPFLSKCLSPPDSKLVKNAVLKLKELGGLRLLNDDENFQSTDGDLTYVGKIMKNLPIDVQLSKLIVLGYLFSILDEIIIIAAGLNIKSIFKNNFNKKLDDYSLKIRFANGSGCDAIAILNAYKYWQLEREKGTLRNFEDEEKWCNRNGLDRKNLHEMRLLIFKIQDRLMELNLKSLTGTKAIIWDIKEKPLIIKLCLAGAFIPNMFIKGESDEITEREVSKTLLGLDPYRTIYFRKMDRNQIGEVYVDRIKEKLVECGIADTTNEMDVSFDSEKVFVKFRDNNYMIDDVVYDEKCLRNSAIYAGSICKQVYKAIKFRKTGATWKSFTNKRETSNDDSYNAPFEISVMHNSETTEYARNLNALEEVRGIPQAKKIYYEFPESIFFPRLNEKEMFGFITAIEHCNKFYFQPCDGENSCVLGEIEKSLKKCEFTKARDLKAEKLVIIFHQPYFFYKRAKILRIYNETADCFLLDYGDTIELSFDDIYEMCEEDMQYFFSIFERCFECRLFEIVPSYTKCPLGKWTVEAIEDFRRVAHNAFVKIVVYSTLENVAVVEIFKNETNINEYLIQKGFARKCRENYASRLNHADRERVQNYDPKWMPREEEFKELQNNWMKLHIPSPPLNICTEVIKLNGPHSPLATSISDIAIMRRGSIQIEPNSVESVVLDDSVENYDGTLIVAAEIMKNNQRGLTLYNVSTLPNIIGLPTLIAMMFSPNLLFYHDDDKSKFLGIRFGLGFDERNYESFYHDHDCYLPIKYQDVLEEDITDINNLRLSMSSLLGNGRFAPDITDDDKVEHMNEIKNTVVKILSKNRKPVENSFSPDPSHIWRIKGQNHMCFIRDRFKAGPYRSIQLPPLKM